MALVGRNETSYELWETKSVPCCDQTVWQERVKCGHLLPRTANFNQVPLT